jgi:tetratricopeptide (TPR) repeat protein
MKKALIGSVFFAIVAILLVTMLNARSPEAQSQPKHAVPEEKIKQADRLNNIGIAYMNQQAFEKALKYFQEAYAANPNLKAAQLNQGIALLNLQKVGEALPIFQEILKSDPKNAKVWYNLGLLHKSSGDSTQALDAFKKAVELAPNDADAHYFLGLAYSQTGDNKSAAAEFQEALRLQPFHASAEFGLARAYQKMGEPEQAKAHLARFQHLTQTKLGSPITLAYGEQGPLSLVATVGAGSLEAPPTIPVKFADATQQWELTGKTLSPQPKSPMLGAGACGLDYDGDGQPDIFFTNYSTSGGIGLFRNLGNGKFSDVTKVVGLPSGSAAIACAAADYDNDGKTDLAVAYADHVALYRNEGGKFSDVTDAVGLKAKGASRGLLFVDYDHDGDADLFVTTANSGSQMWRNNGNNTFTDVTSETGLSFEGSGTAAIASDVNNDRAVDIVVTRESGAPLLFTNPREGKWIASNPWPESAKGANSITSLDFNKDGWMDFAISTQNAPGLLLLRNVGGTKFEQVPLPPTVWSRGTSVIAIDYDNDGFVDLVAAGINNKGASEIRLFRNIGNRKFEDMTSLTGLDRLKLKSDAFLSTADLDSDGDIDFIVTQAGTAPILLRNDGGNQNKSLRVSLKGLADNKSGLGTKVEVFAGDLWQKWEVHSGGGPGQGSTDIIAGLGKRTQVDVVRMLWPTGVIQDEIDVSIAKPQQIVEIDRRGSSCPVLFAWDGTHYQFISDMIGSAVVGHWVGPDERNVPDPTEYLKVSGSLIKARNRRLSFRFMEPMEEVVYLDQVRLLAVDHPADYDVYPNEYFASNPPFPEFKVIAAKESNVRLPAGAWDEHGRNVLPHLLHRDHDYVTGFKLLNYSGYTEPHSLELDLGEPYEGGTLRLLMHGFIEYFTATSMYAAHQAGLDPVAPYVEAQDGNGKWVRVVDDMGFPAGLPRTTVADLTGKLPVGTRRIRIGTNLQIYWDQILIDRTASPSPTHVQDVPLSVAQLKFHGYPRDIERKTNARGDHYYVYEEVSKTGPFARQAGAYTRLGNVKNLISETDDRFAVFGSGDVIELEFDPSRLPALRSGWVRDYFFFADGYEKDMDFYAAEGLTVYPLPYSTMQKYPYLTNDSFPQDKPSVDYLLDYNTRFFTGNPAGVRSSYRFSPEHGR